MKGQLSKGNAGKSIPQHPGKGRGGKPQPRGSTSTKDRRTIKVDVKSLPAGPLEAPQWETAFAAEASTEGSDGVVFIATLAGVYVVKASSRPAEEYFATRALSMLGIPVVSVRVLSHVEREWRSIKAAIKSASQQMTKRGDIEGAQRLVLRLRGPLQRPQLLVMSFVPQATPLLGNPRVKEFLDIAVGSGCLQDPCAVSRLKVLGRCLAMDVLFNNFDRCAAPCWDVNSEGNGENLLLSPTGLIPIDNTLNSISAKDALSAEKCQGYVRRSYDFLNNVCCAASDEIAPMHERRMAIDCVREFVRANTLHELSAQALLHVQSGFLDMVGVIGAIDSTSNSNSENAAASKVGVNHHGSKILAMLEKLHSEVVNETIQIDWEGVWKASSKQIDVDFLQTMVSVFQQVAEKHTQLFAVNPQVLGPDYQAHSLAHEAPEVSHNANVLNAMPELWAMLSPDLQCELRSTFLKDEQQQHLAGVDDACQGN